MSTYIFHLTLYDLLVLTSLASALTLALLSGFARRADRPAGKLLAGLLLTLVFQLSGILGADAGLLGPWLFLLPPFMMGPLLFFYVRKNARPGWKTSRKDLLHFLPLPAAIVCLLGIKQPVPILQLLACVALISYLYLSYRLIARFYKQLEFIGGDRYRRRFRWLERWLAALALVTLSGLIGHTTTAVHISYLVLSIILIAMAGIDFSRRELHLVKPLPSGKLNQKGSWLKNSVKAGRYYQDPELSLRSLADLLGLHTHELSHIINTALNKSFTDFINEYRVKDAARKMQDPAYAHITLLGIAYEAGFSSQSSFNRIFKQITGKSPQDHKKEQSSYKLGSPGSVLPLVSQENNKRKVMFRTYFKIALRQFRQQKMYAAIKVGGFAFSIAACLLITLYIHNETSYDRSYPAADRIYRVLINYDNNGTVEKGPEWPAPLAGTLKAQFPQVENSGRLRPISGGFELRRADQAENSYEEGLSYADQNLLNLFKLPMVYGARTQALSRPAEIVLSKRKADKYFPGQNPVGKVMYINNDQTTPYTVGGVMENFPETSHLQYDFLLSLSGREFEPGEQNNWNEYNYPTYVMLRAGTDAALTQQQMTAVVVKNYFLPGIRKGGAKSPEQEAAKIHMALQPVGDINLYSYDVRDGLSHGDIRFIWLFGGVAAFILVIACINFVNLTTARSANRAKEVGLRKVIGSDRSSLIGQFLTESILYSLVSFLIGLLLAWLLLPWFNVLAAKSLSMPWLTWWLWPVILVSSFIVGMIAGLYPAFYLSGFKPIQVLKGTLSAGSKGSVLRNSLVVFQFTASILLIIGTTVIYNQMHYLLNQKVGFDKDQVVILQGTDALGKKVNNLKTELSRLASVKSVSISDYLPVEGTNRNGIPFVREGRTGLDAGVQGQIWQVDDSYLKTLGIKLVEGRDFSHDLADDTTGKTVIINQTLANKLNLKHPVGTRITAGGTFTVIGVAADFNFNSMHQQIEPLAMQFGMSPSLMTVKVRGGDMKSALQSIGATWKQFAPDQPIRYTFLDESFARMYADVSRMGSIFTTFAVLAIAIACLGLFALSAFMAEQRSKEIGIRKVLGASVSGIAAMLSLDFVKLVALSILIAVPLAWWGMSRWLQGFAYRTPLHWWIFVASGLAAILIALVTVSFQAIKAAVSNPVKSLRSE